MPRAFRSADAAGRLFAPVDLPAACPQMGRFGQVTARRRLPALRFVRNRTDADSGSLS